MHLLCVLITRSERRQGDQSSSTLILAFFACMKDGAKGCLASTSNLWQEVNPSLFRRVWPKTNIWTSGINRNHGIQTNGRIAFKSKQLWTETVESWWFQKRNAHEKTSPYTLNRWNRYQSPESPPQGELRPSHSHHISCRCFHRFSSFHSTAHLGVCRRLAEGLCWKVPWKDWKRLDVCSYGVVLMFFLQHSAPHYFREPIAHRFESRCHTIARQAKHLYIQIHHWICSSWEESEGIGKHTHTPKHPESRNVDLDPSLPSCRRQKNGPWNDIPMARVATLGRGGFDILLMTTTWKRFYVQGPHSPFSQGLQFSG